MMDNKAKVFVIMPFSDDFMESYEMMKEHFSDRYEFSHAGQEDNQQNILADIIPPIYEADVVLADLTNLNPNVMYELGIAHSLNKKTIIITRDKPSSLPFDLKQYRVKEYSTQYVRFCQLLHYLEKNLGGAVDGSVLFSNPVNDFLDRNKTSVQKLHDANVVTIGISDSDKGYLDFIADIEEDAHTLTSTIGTLNSDMNAMSKGINTCSGEIQRVSKTGGSGNASFVRKQLRKAAGYISNFSSQLKEHNEIITALWSKIEVNSMGLIEHQYSAMPRNKEALTGYLRGLLLLKQSIETSRDAIAKMKQSSLGNLGVERELNQSIRFLDTDLAGYIAMTEQMTASIDRIIAKSKFVVGDLSQEQAN